MPELDFCSYRIEEEIGPEEHTVSRTVDLVVKGPMRNMRKVDVLRLIQELTSIAIEMES